MYGQERRRLGDMLMAAGLLSEIQLGEVLQRQKEEGGRLGEILVENGYVSEEDLLATLSAQLNIPFVSIKDYVIEPEVPLLIPEKVARRHLLIPIEVKGDSVTVAVADPNNVQGLDDVRLMLDKDLEIVLAKREEIAAAHDEFYVSDATIRNIFDDLSEEDIEIVKDDDDLTEEGGDEEEENKIIKYVNLILLEALRNRASDVHLEPFENEFIIRQRIDGVLQKMPAPPKAVQSSVIARIKVMAELNIAETRLPQDGRIKLSISGKQIDLRVSTLPTVFGESVVLRLLDRSATLLSLPDLGMDDAIRERTEKMIDNPNGIVIVTGPTGCGKTTTLYACVQELNNPEVKFITVEDPVEYEVDGLVQVQVRERVGMTFAAALRSILRQDPDIVLIGEIRDVETAEISIQASLTGHLVLTTLHTNEAAGAITRLVDMGLEPFLLSSTILGICAQRLVRTICPMCKETAEVNLDEAALIAPRGEDPSKYTFYKGRGCPDCANTGYKGRIGLFELLTMSEEIEELVLDKSPANVIQNKARELGMISMAEDGWNKAVSGITTVDEVLRVAPVEGMVK